MSYRYLDHTADIGIEVHAESQNQAYEEMFFALINLIYDIDTVKALEERTVEIFSKTNSGKLVELLNRILYLIDGDDFLVKDLEVKSLRPFIARITGENRNNNHHKFKSMVKGVTYYQAFLRKKGEFYHAKVFLDV